MFIVSLWLSAGFLVFLLLTNYVAGRLWNSVAILAGLVFLGVAAVIFLASLVFSYFLFAVSAGVLALCAVVCVVRGHLPRPALIGVFLVTVLCYAIVGWNTLQTLKELRNRYPIESLETRLSYEDARPNSVLLAGAQPRPTSSLVVQIESKLPWYVRQRFRNRTAMLRELHEDTVQAFIDSPGFGIGRGVQNLPWDVLIEEIETIPQPEEERSLDHDSWGKANVLPPQSLNDGFSMNLADFHAEQMFLFINPAGLGYTKEWRKVAGFQEHHLTRSYESGLSSSDTWHMQRVELLSLLKHSEPCVYLSDNLPRMDELRKAKTRPLDEFEARRLPELLKGEDLVFDRTAKTVRLLGAIRAANQCLDCHNVQRGDLLGAFSYRLGR